MPVRERTLGNPVIGGGDANVEVYAIGTDMSSDHQIV